MPDMIEANTLSAMEQTTAGSNVAPESPSSDDSDVGVILEGGVVLQDPNNVGHASAMLFGLKSEEDEGGRRRFEHPEPRAPLALFRRR
ncbi:hypothetical protein F2P81_007558 [Xyrichtys novacula]|uniref:Uncharacterized protein n=1 Tax=Xyrichtys novacula TaxID=13765 RepID=A0AAV1FRD9_XYRNO|nr:hypothetical protein F2P81_007558 [Xyrichtys novacula]